MNELFKQYIESLEPSFQRLIQMEPVTVANLPLEAPKAGIYLFFEAGQHLYVGRTNTIRKRLQNHCRPSSGHNSATFAFRLAREITGQTIATYTEQGSRTELENDPVFSPVFTAQKKESKIWMFGMYLNQNQCARLCWKCMFRLAYKHHIMTLIITNSPNKAIVRTQTALRLRRTSWWLFALEVLCMGAIISPVNSTFLE